jgi:serine/threonine-protein kinase
MELLEGMTLEELVERHGPLPPARAIHLLLQVCGALHEAHHIGLIHRDIKPANIFLGRRGEIADFVKVLDFGLVRELSSTPETAQSNANLVVGTPLYMSPEAILDPERVDPRTDIYGIGGVAYFLVTGTVPFQGNTVVEVCAHHLHSPPPPPSEQANVPADLERVILACLEKSPDARPAGARPLAEALERCADAGKWSGADADAWWAKVAASRQASASSTTASLGSGARTRRTLVAADLAQRVTSEKQRPA